MSGGKGGSTTSEIRVPDYIEGAARRNLDKADAISQVGFTPFYGADVASFVPLQEASFQNTADVADAFGMATPRSPTDIMGNMGAPQTYANGVTGYSSAPMFQDAVDTLGYFRPNQKALLDSFFVNPYTGFDPSGAYRASPASGVAMEMQGQNPSFRANTTDYGANSSYYNNPNGGFANVVIGYDANGSPIMATQPAASGDLGGMNVDPAVQDMVAMRRKNRSDENKAILDEMMDAQMQDYLAKKELGVRQIGGQDVISRSPFDEGSSFAGTNYATYDGSQGFQAPFPLNIAQNIFDPRVEDSGDRGFQNPNTKSVVATGYDAGEVDPTLARMAGYTDQIENKAGDYTLFTGRGVDGQGVVKTPFGVGLGVVGDIAGDIGDGLGLTNFSSQYAIDQRKKAEAERIAAERAAQLQVLAQAQAARDISPPPTSSRRKKNKQAQASANNFTSSSISKNAKDGKVTKESYKGGGF